MKKENIIELYCRLNPEEACLNGLSKLSAQSKILKEIRPSLFEGKLREHLLFYESKLLCHPFEEYNKITLLYSYHLQRKKRLTKQETSYVKRTLASLKKNSGELTLADTIALRALRATAQIYSRTLGDTRMHLPTTTRTKIYRNPVNDFVVWQKDLYDLSIIDKASIVAEIKRLSAAKKRLPAHSVERYYADTRRLVEFFVDYFQTLFSCTLHNLAITQLPSYLKPIIPSAAAYTFGRFDTKQQRVAFVDFAKKIPPSKLLFVLFHEIFGHIFHFQMVDSMCTEPLKRISYLSRFPVTEGFALCAEDFFVKSFSNGVAGRDFERALGKTFVAKDTIAAIKKTALDQKIRRYVRYLFELEVYGEQKNPYSVIADLVGSFELDRKETKEDLLSFLPTPGYASCYIGGYEILKEIGCFEDPVFRAYVGKKGFDCISEFKK